MTISLHFREGLRFMGKVKEASTQAPQALPLKAAAAAAAHRLLTGSAPAQNDALALPASSLQDTHELALLKERCVAFGIHPSTEELLLAGLHLLTQQTETGLEVAVLQSLRADRSCVPRRHRRG